MEEKQKLLAGFGDYLGEAEVVIYSVLAVLLFINGAGDDRECRQIALGRSGSLDDCH